MGDFNKGMDHKATKNSPSQIGRYEIRKNIGEGGMGKVYLAYDPFLDREVALKLLAIGKTPSAEESIERFKREARATAKLQHPHIVTIHDVGIDNNQCF